VECTLFAAALPVVVVVVIFAVRIIIIFR